jgi:NADPH2:quinone reductase
MKAIIPERAGGPEVLRLVERSVPKPKAQQVCIRVEAAGLNRHDLNQRSRGHPPAGSTDILGLEVAGYVSAVGAGVAPELLGRRVCALVDGGGYAEYTLADCALLFEWPEPLSAAQAACLPEALVTLQLNLIELGGLTAQQTLLIHGGTSGIGMAAIPFARRLGVDVIVTAGSDEKCARALAHGARAAINYRSQDFVAQVLSLTDAQGADVILDTVGGAYAQRNLAALAPDGRIVHLSPAAPDYSVPLAQLMAKRARITGAFLRALPLARKAALADDLRANVWPLVTSALCPVIDRCFPLADAAAAHQYMEGGGHIGKIALLVE